MRSVSDQSLRDLGGRWSVLNRQKLDHVELDRLLERLERTRGAEQRRVLLRTYRLVFPHAFAEESVLWPVLRAVLPDGHELTLQVEQEHQGVNELVIRLDELDDGDPERDEVLQRLIAVLREDVRDEEDVLLPRLQEKLSPARLRALGVAWEAVRRTAPTRPHPLVARRPPGNVAAALPLTVTDRLRDLLESAVLRSSSPVEPILTESSSLLARAAHAIEHLPIMRRGEDPSTARGHTAA
ncbi:hemerythrin domain-containing protein [Rhodococcus sp. IEGM 1408]|uniref:hemerythrin domain-containing protein n=1 Tax=Rhodococcus sp. IEGM 1408 TaxID=3082220 RepID=UPI002953157C|nr:hemerythrin domain-containing protein [Rhodococcus sp. IEGM 1408]MDV8002741.1 hemerythrin domain-containing protein [Rhodococcus sp. IEGM 1408]